MMEKKIKGKILRKQNRCKKLLMKHENLEAVDFPTKILFVGNGGLVCGIQRETLVEVFTPFGAIHDVLMLQDKSYCFVVFENESSSLLAMSKINGMKVKDDSDFVFYLCYVKDMPKVSINKSVLPPGLKLLKDFITEEDELKLLGAIDFKSEEGVMKHRKVKHFGYEFNYNSNNVDRNKPLEEKIPLPCHKFLEKLLALGRITRMPDQLTVNQYAAGQGIPPHIDTHSAFEDEIISLSLGSQVIMDFYHPEQVSVPVLLPVRSVIIMTGESRYLWKHGITPRKTDVIPVFGDDSCHLTLGHRSTRTSFTFRTVRQEPCNCEYVKQCDSQNFNSNLSQGDIVADTEAKGFERQYVTQVYEDIACHFSSTREKPWPLVSKFVEAVPPGSIVIDAGCGSGRYLSAGESSYRVGCDISMNLAKICAEKNFNVLVGDTTNLPFRSECADICICIAVIHHMVTESRRLEALREIYRVLKCGGKALVYVWALEQQTTKGPSKYLSYSKMAKKDKQNSDEPPKNQDCQYDIGVHSNRTNFEHQDVFVPWHNKATPNAKDEKKVVYHRYYHVFRKGELESLLDDNVVRIIDSYYDQGNWCVIFEKR